VLRKSNVIVELFSTTWTTSTAEHLGAVPGLPKFQTFWELYTLLLALLVWGSRFSTDGIRIFGDNTGALANSLRLTGKRHLDLDCTRDQLAQDSWQMAI
jgi:hypothetical protein